MDALRAGRAKEYIPECFLPRNPTTGEVLAPNHFDNRYIKTDQDMGEGTQNKIDVEQPAIPHDSYLASYITALDLCLQGIISPSTLGIDVKKLDNAEAQREKEKTTLYTRDAIVEALQEELPAVIGACINAYHLLHGEAVEEVKVDIPFGEYANPSFESQVETLHQGQAWGSVMSVGGPGGRALWGQQGRGVEERRDCPLEGRAGDCSGRRTGRQPGRRRLPGQHGGRNTG